jgi:glycosyltransferase involved in cell wall biosynthesis
MYLQLLEVLFWEIMHSIELSIVIPCYNEALNIEALVGAGNALLQQNTNVQIVLVDNGSTDNTRSVLYNLIRESAFANQYKLVTVNENIGYGNGILQGLLQANGAILSWTHADMQTPITDVIKGAALLKQSKEEMLLVKGNRVNRKAFDQFFSTRMEQYVNWKLKCNLHDINAQPKIFTKLFFNKVKKDAPTDFSFDLYFLYWASKLGSIKTFDVQYLPRAAGEAKGGDGGLALKWKLAKRTIQFVKKFKQNII